MRWCANKDTGPKGVDWGVPHQLKKRMSTNEDAGLQKGVYYEISHRLEKRTSASEDAGPKERWIVRSHVNLKENEWKARKKKYIY